MQTFSQEADNVFFKKMCISVLFSLTWSISDSSEPNPLLTSALGIGGNFGKKIVKFSHFTY